MLKRSAVGALVLVLLFVLPSTVPARDVDRTSSYGTGVQALADPNIPHNLTDRGVPRALPRSATATDTTVLGSWTFNPGGVCDAQGWVSVDITAQLGDYFHVDDFAGLGGGDAGRLVPLEGGQSLWCGLRPDANNPAICGYATLPGYGNGWLQAFCTANCVDVTGDVALDFLVAWDSEPAYDYTYVQYDTCDADWQELHAYNGVGSGFASHVVNSALHSGNVRFRLYFASDGAFSDQDGYWPTDGAFIVDSLTVRDAGGVVLPTELFEVESVGDNDAASGNWQSCTPPGFGDYAGLVPGTGVLQEDPCQFNASCLWAFFVGSTYDYSCGGHPQQAAVPYGNERDQYLRNEVWSPLIPLAAAGSTTQLEYEIYDYNPLNSLVFYVWHVRSIVDGCATRWRDNLTCCYPTYKSWRKHVWTLDPFIAAGATQIQVALGAWDMCAVWGGIYGDCTCHTQSPLFDNVKVYGVTRHGPAWRVRDLDLFQDNFSADGTLTGTARADAANDILPQTSAMILPGDSVSVTVRDAEFGVDHHITGDPASGPAVYCYVSVDGPHGGTTGAPLVDDPRYNFIGTQMVDGRTWTQIQMDTSYTPGGGVVDDDYNIDLNDNLFVPGDTVWFFLGARSAPPSNEWSYFSFDVPTTTAETNDISQAAANADEFTILPAAGLSPNNGILYVDGMNFRGAQPYFDWSFNMMGILDDVDRYDIRGPSSAVGNHPGGRVVSVLQQLTPVYNAIIWNTGDLTTAFGDGSGMPDKSDDTGMLEVWLDNLLFPGQQGVYLSGDDVAWEWLYNLTSPSAVNLRAKYMDFTVATGDHTTLVDVSPYGVGDLAGFFRDTTPPFAVDTLIAYGGCPLINDFDVLGPTGSSTVQMWYQDPVLGAPAILSQISTNGLASTVRFVLSGFSYHYIRDAYPAGEPARVEHLWRIITWMAETVLPPVGADTPTAVNDLRQNHPNPFNPVTTIEYSIRESAHVSLRVYNVAGQLVRTLVDDLQSPEQVQPVVWDGRNEAGQAVSSGVYFYKLVTKGYQKTRKMVLLK